MSIFNSLIARVALKLFPSGVRKQLRNFEILSAEYGQYASIRHNAARDSNELLPWYTYPAIEYLSQFDFSKLSVFEWGAGNSSAYWAKRCRSIVSVEHSELWYEKLSGNLAQNQTLLLEEDQIRYLNAIDDVKKLFNIIIIDGICRKECAKKISSGGYLHPESGLIVFDNSDWYPRTCAALRDALDLIQVDFHGFGPINDYTWTTSVFFSRRIKLKEISRQPAFSKAAVTHDEGRVS